MRSRLVGRELKAKQKAGLQEQAGSESDLFASTPLLEAMKLILCLFMSIGLSKAGKRYKVGLYDIKRAYFNAKATREVFIKLPEELIPEGTDPTTVIAYLACPCMGKVMLGPIGKRNSLTA